MEWEEKQRSSTAAATTTKMSVKNWIEVLKMQE